MSWIERPIARIGGGLILLAAGAGAWAWDRHVDFDPKIPPVVREFKANHKSLQAKWEIESDKQDGFLKVIIRHSQRIEAYEANANKAGFVQEIKNDIGITEGLLTNTTKLRPVFQCHLDILKMELQYANNPSHTYHSFQQDLESLNSKKLVLISELTGETLREWATMYGSYDNVMESLGHLKDERMYIDIAGVFAVMLFLNGLGFCFWAWKSERKTRVPGKQVSPVKQVPKKKTRVRKKRK